jgi:hypothetical protein
MANIVNNFFTLASLGTLAGASGAVVVVANTYRTLTRTNSVYPPFVVALAVALLGAHYSGKLGGIDEYAIAILNACLLFCTALGMNGSIVGIRNRTRSPRGGVKPHGGQPVAWLSPWIKG